MASPKRKRPLQVSVIRTSHPKDPTKMSFLDLPGELRNRVYREALLVRSGVIDLIAVPKERLPDYDIKGLLEGTTGRPSLLAVSRQVFDEAKRIYYEENHFCLTQTMLTPDAVEVFTASLPDTSRFKSISIKREYFIMDLRVNVDFTAQLILTNVNGLNQPRVLIQRNDKIVFPGINTKKIGDRQEPCRCEVKALAFKSNDGGYTNGSALFEFLLAYAEKLTKKAKNTLVKTCEKCVTAYRL